ncbi:MAG: ABC transporter ATP-binding protein [Patulibacter sp.]
MNYLQARGVTVRLGGRAVLDGVDLEVPAGACVGILGPNGSGKSTLLRALAGLRQPDAGEVLLRGVPIGRLRARARARELAVVAQEEQLDPDLTVGEVVALGLTPYRRPWDAGGEPELRAVAAALARVDLEGCERQSVARLSGGERRRVLIARALAQATPAMLLDEPTNHLDIRHQLEVVALLRALRQTVVMSLHDLGLAARACDQVVVLAAGRVRAAGPPAEVLEPQLVLDTFGVDAVQVADPRTGLLHLLLDLPPRPNAALTHHRPTESL